MANSFAQICASVTGVEEIGNDFTLEFLLNATASTATLGLDFELGILVPEGCPLAPANTPPFFPSTSPSASLLTSSVLINFVAGMNISTPACGVVTILDDGIFEPTENIILSFSGTSPYDVEYSGDTAPSITINEDPLGKTISRQCFLLEHMAFTDFSRCGGDVY